MIMNNPLIPNSDTSDQQLDQFLAENPCLLPYLMRSNALLHELELLEFQARQNQIVHEQLSIHKIPALESSISSLDQQIITKQNSIKQMKEQLDSEDEKKHSEGMMGKILGVWENRRQDQLRANIINHYANKIKQRSARKPSKNKTTSVSKNDKNFEKIERLLRNKQTIIHDKQNMGMAALNQAQETQLQSAQSSSVLELVELSTKNKLAEQKIAKLKQEISSKMIKLQTVRQSIKNVSQAKQHNVSISTNPQTTRPQSQYINISEDDSQASSNSSPQHHTEEQLLPTIQDQNL